MGAAVSAAEAIQVPQHSTPRVLVKTSTVDTVTTEYFAEHADGPARRWRKTCSECGMVDDFTKWAGATDVDVFARHSRFAGMHYRLHTTHQLGPDSFGTKAVF